MQESIYITLFLCLYPLCHPACRRGLKQSLISGVYITLFVCSTLSATQQERIKTVTHIRSLYITLFVCSTLSATHAAGENKNSHSYRVWVMQESTLLSFLCLYPQQERIETVSRVGYGSGDYIILSFSASYLLFCHPGESLT